MTNEMHRRLCDKRKRAQRLLDKGVKVCYTVSDTDEGTTMHALKFYATEDDSQTFCDPCSLRFIHENHGAALFRLTPNHERCCDLCGAWRDGIGAGKRVLA